MKPIRNLIELKFGLVDMMHLHLTQLIRWLAEVKTGKLTTNATRFAQKMARAFELNVPTRIFAIEDFYSTQPGLIGK